LGEAATIDHGHETAKLVKIHGRNLQSSLLDSVTGTARLSLIRPTSTFGGVLDPKATDGLVHDLTEHLLA
jgi:hypothetical protein